MIMIVLMITIDLTLDDDDDLETRRASLTMVTSPERNLLTGIRTLTQIYCGFIIIYLIIFYRSFVDLIDLIDRSFMKAENFAT